MRPADHTALTAADRARLAAILGRLASDFPGERDAAALAATRFVRTRGIQWIDVLVPALPLPERAGAASDADDPLAGWPGGWRNAAATCARYGREVLTEWEWDFVVSLRTFARISDKQRTILRRLLDKVVDATGAVP